MFKKQRVILITIILLMFPSVVNGLGIANYIDKTKLDSGIIEINSGSTASALRISKDNVNYDYYLNGNNTFPLQLGNGEYIVYILENVEDNKYRIVQKETVVLEIDDVRSVFLQSMQLISWNDEMKAIKKAKELTKDAKDDHEKVALIYNYIISNIKYDYYKVKEIKSNYIPNIDETLDSNKGICFDYASLFGAMLRSVGVPTKLVMGYKNDIYKYHAWNQVYLKNIDKWVTIDTTYDAGLGQIDNTDLIKDENQYIVKKFY